MIIDTIKNADRYFSLHPRFKAAFAFLMKADIAGLSDGRYVVDGDEVFALVSRGTGKGRSAAVLEAHRKYIDIQFVLSGTDEIGIRTEECRSVTQPYDGKKDIVFFGDAVSGWMCLRGGHFAVFYPGETHAPLAGSGEVVKIVIKVKNQCAE